MKLMHWSKNNLSPSPVAPWCLASNEIPESKRPSSQPQCLSMSLLISQVASLQPRLDPPASASCWHYRCHHTQPAPGSSCLSLAISQLFKHPQFLKTFVLEKIGPLPHPQELIKRWLEVCLCILVGIRWWKGEASMPLPKRVTSLFSLPSRPLPPRDSQL